MSHKFDVSKKERLESPQRKALLPAQKVIELLKLHGPETVADIGCGTGYISAPLAQKLTEGKVIACDISNELLEEVEKKRIALNLENLIPLHSQENTLPIESESVDLALLVMVMHEVEERELFLKEVERVLKPHGRVIILEWDRHLEFGPPQSERVMPEEMIALFDTLGFSLKEVHEFSPSLYFHVYGR